MAVDLLGRLTAFNLPASKDQLKDLYSGGRRGNPATPLNRTVPMGYGMPADRAIIPTDTAIGAHPDISLLDFESVTSYPPYSSVNTPHVNDGGIASQSPPDMFINPQLFNGTDINGNTRSAAAGSTIYGYSQNNPFSNTAMGSITNGQTPGGQTLYSLLWIPEITVPSPGTVTGRQEMRVMILGNQSNSNATFKSFYINGMQFVRTQATFDGYNSTGRGCTQWRFFSGIPATNWHNPFTLTTGAIANPVAPVWSTTLP